MFRHARTDCAQSIAFQGDNVTYLEWWNANYPKQGSALQDATLRAWNAARLDLLEDQEKHGELQGDARVVAHPGWKLVPIEPTTGMLMAGNLDSSTKELYQAMLAKAPEPPTEYDTELEQRWPNAVTPAPKIEPSEVLHPLIADGAIKGNGQNVEPGVACPTAMTAWTFPWGKACAACGQPVGPPTNRHMDPALMVGDRIWHGYCAPANVTGTFTVGEPGSASPVARSEPTP